MIHQPWVFAIVADDGGDASHPPFDIDSQSGTFESAGASVGNAVLHGYGGKEHPAVVEDFLAVVEEEEGVVGEEFHGLLALLLHLRRGGFHDGFPPPDGEVLSRGVEFHTVVDGRGEFHFREA